MSNWSLHDGDCLEVLRGLAADSVDSIVTDPPAGISFMGKDWDSDRGGRLQWVPWMTRVMLECSRVMKPGAHAVVWAIPRTSHWTATALEDAGFEVRDVVTHLFGTGFPKSLDVSKAIDKAAGAEREITGPNRFEGINGKANLNTYGIATRPPATAPATAPAKQWQGWGTALKPAAEFWILARKPLGEKTVAANVLKHGTGAVNVDGCRINVSPDDPNHAPRSVPYSGPPGMPTGSSKGRPVPNLNMAGRFPANLLLSHNPDCEDTCTDGCAVKALDEQSGELKSGANPTRRQSPKTKNAFGKFGVECRAYRGADVGRASRFFYCAKASKRDRGADNTHPTVKSTQLMRYLCRLITPPGGTVLDPFAGSGSTGVAALAEGFRFIGIEQEKAYISIAENRLEDACAP